MSCPSLQSSRKTSAFHKPSCVLRLRSCVRIVFANIVVDNRNLIIPPASPFVTMPQCAAILPFSTTPKLLLPNRLSPLPLYPDPLQSVPRAFPGISSGCSQHKTADNPQVGICVFAWTLYNSSYASHIHLRWGHIHSTRAHTRTGYPRRSAE